MTAPRPDPAARPATHGAPWLNPANFLTVLRLLLVPVVAVLTFAHGGHHAAWRVAACGVFFAASVTDRLDGAVARRYGLVTAFGKLADPIADKALTGTALVSLSLLGDLPGWVTGVILAREVGVTALRFSVLHLGLIPASRGGKLKTAVQGLAIGCYLLPIGEGPLGTLRALLLAAALAITVLTGLDYVARAVRLRATALRAGAPASPGAREEVGRAG